MRLTLLILISLLVSICLVQCKTLPPEFHGTFKLERDENFDDYLTARGYGWIMRQVIKLASVTKIFRDAASGKPNRYDMENLTTKKDTHHRDWALGEEFSDEALDSTIHKITFDLKNSTILTEKHIKTEDPSDVETYEYTREGDYLVMKMCWQGTCCRRYYRKECC
ncbi:hypothetical protein AB6A40_006853 [Gnathostoma spinigerum]|uniref:Cytosolic fatty-acid binding proteins domain-containing protein n=1 Tax=Gnathostoma spinigerum TaxID=75299 RepID=A0ABD6EJK5_9BILA